MGRRTKILLGLLAGVPVLALVGATVVVPRIDLATMVATRASAALGRDVTIESLRVSPGLGLGVELRGAMLANIEGGSRPAMAEVARLTATLDLLPLLVGQVVVRSAAIEGFTLLLERAPGRVANWHFGPRPPAGAAPAAPAPPDRSGLPMVHALSIAGSEVTFRTTSGAQLRTRLDTASLTAAALDEPAALRVQGSYNDVPLALDATLGSFATLRDARIPFPVTLRATAPDTALLFEGTATDPLNADGMDGRITLAASTPAAILAMAGASGGPAVPVELAGRFTRQGDLWRLVDGTGTLDGAALTAPLLELTEGSAGSPDSIVARLGVARLDLVRLLGAPAPEAGQGAAADPPFVVPAMPDPLIHAEITAQEFTHSRLGGTNAEVKIEVAPARITLELGFVPGFAEALTALGEIVPAGAGARLTAEVNMRGADLDGLRRQVGLRALPVTGRANVNLEVAAEGATLGAAQRGARVSAVVGMTGGAIAREVIEMASTDIRALLRTSRGTTPLTCLLAAIDIRAGRGQAAPVRIRAGTGTIAGIASFDLNRQQLDLVIGSERATTDFFALDIPVRVHGSFENPDIAPAEWSREARARMARGDVAPLPPDLRGIAQRNPCYRTGGMRR